MSSNLFLKQNLTAQQLALVDSEMPKKAKSKTLAYIFWFFLGVLGGHRFYAGDVGRGILMAVTLGGLGIWAFIDVFFIGSRIEEKNDQIELAIIQRVTAQQEIATKQVAAASEVN